MNKQFSDTDILRSIKLLANELLETAHNGGNDEHLFNLHADNEVFADVEVKLAAIVDAIDFDRMQGN